MQTNTSLWITEIANCIFIWIVLGKDGGTMHRRDAPLENLLGKKSKFIQAKIPRKKKLCRLELEEKNLPHSKKKNLHEHQGKLKFYHNCR